MQSSSASSSPSEEVEEVKRDFADMGGGTVTLEGLQESDSGSPLRLVLSNPGRRNALSGAMMCQMHDALGTLARWAEEEEARARTRARALLLHSEGGGDKKVVCSGGDLDVVRRIMSPEQGARMSLLVHDCLLRLRSLPLATAFLLDGRALGGGAELAMSTDFRLWSPRGSLSFVQANMGVTTGWGGGARLVDVVGERKVSYIFFIEHSLG